MTVYVTNRLNFQSNSKTILSFLKSKAPTEESVSLFSLNSIKMVPPQLQLPLHPFLAKLGSMNMDMPDFKENVRQTALKEIFFGIEQKPSNMELTETINGFKGSLEGSELNILNQALNNYQQFGFFCQYDWQMTHWGTVQDIHSVVESTFVEQTTYIEFETLLTPPVAALKTLADTFPSVRFRLLYKYQSEDNWTNMEIFPITPFGY